MSPVRRDAWGRSSPATGQVESGGTDAQLFVIQ